jgi:hypothetical protein
MILGEGTGDRGKAELFALRYKHSGAELAK